MDHLQSQIIQFKLEVDACPYCRYLEQQHAWNPLFNYDTSTLTRPGGEDRVTLAAVWQADPHPYRQRIVLCQTSPLNSNNQLYKTRTWLAESCTDTAKTKYMWSWYWMLYHSQCCSNIKVLWQDGRMQSGYARSRTSTVNNTPITSWSYRRILEDLSPLCFITT